MDAVDRRASAAHLLATTLYPGFAGPSDVRRQIRSSSAAFSASPSTIASGDRDNSSLDRMSAYRDRRARALESLDARIAQDSPGMPHDRPSRLAPHGLAQEDAGGAFVKTPEPDGSPADRYSSSRLGSPSVRSLGDGGRRSSSERRTSERRTPSASSGALGKDHERHQHVKTLKEKLHSYNHNETDQEDEALLAQRRRLNEERQRMLEEQDLAELRMGQRKRLRQAWRQLLITWHQGHALAVAVHHITRYRCLVALQVFREKLTALKRLQDKVGKVLRAMIFAKTRRALNSWQDAVVRGYEMRVQARRALVTWLYASLYRAVSSWTHAARVGHEARRQLRVALAEWHGSRQRAAWAAWQDLFYARTLVLRAASAFVEPRKRRAFLTWSDAAAERGSRLQKVYRSAMSMRAGTMRRGWNSWLISSNAAAQARRRLGRAVSEWSGIRKGAAWRTWHEDMERRRRLRRVCQGLRSPNAARAWRSWAARSKQAVQAQEAMRQVLRGMKSRNGRRALNKWKALAQRGVEVRRVITAITDRRSRLAWNSWTAYGAESRAIFDCVDVALRSWQHAGLRQGLNAWLAAAATAKHAMQRLDVAVSEWKGGSRRAAWAAWTDVSLRRSILKRSLAGLRNLGLRRGFVTWVSTAGSRSECLAKMRRVALAFRARSLRRGLNTLVAASGAAREATRRLRVAVGEWAGGRQLAAWSAWSSQAVTQKRILYKMKGALRSLTHNGARKALNKWTDVHGQYKRLQRVAASVVNRRPRLAFNTWLEVTRSHRDVKLRLRVIMSSVRHADYRRSLNTWLSLAAACEIAKRRVRIAVTEWSGGRQRAAWAAWRDLSAQRRIMRRAGLAFVSPGLRRGWSTWALRHAARARGLTTLKRGAVALRAVGLRRGLNSWAWSAAASHEARQRLMVAVGEWMGRRVLAAWRTWLEEMGEWRRLRRACQGFRSPNVARALRTWVEYAHVRGVRLYRIRGALVSLQNTDLRRGLKTWQATCWEADRLLTQMRSAAAAFKLGGVRIGFSTWIANSLAMRQSRRQSNFLYQSAARTLLSKTVGGCFALWRRSGRQRTKARAIGHVQRCFQRLGARDSLRFALHWWSHSVSWARRQVAVVRYRDTERDLHKSRRTVHELEAEVSELRRDLAVCSDEFAWRASFEAENKALRKQLDASHKECRSWEAKHADLEEKYQMLWRATHDVNYIKDVQPNEEPVVWKVPASKDAVDKIVPGVVDSPRLSTSPNRHPPPPAPVVTRLVSPRVDARPASFGRLSTPRARDDDKSRQSRYGITDHSTFSSRQMRTSISAGGMTSLRQQPSTPLSSHASVAKGWPKSLRTQSPPTRRMHGPGSDAGSSSSHMDATDPNGGFMSGTDWLRAAFHLEKPPHQRGLKEEGAPSSS